MIVVTRPDRQGIALAAMIEGAGGKALRFPLIEIVPCTSTVLDSIIDRLDAFDLAIFISRNAVEQGLARVAARRVWPPNVAVAAVGTGTRHALEAHGIRNAFSPDGEADSEALLRHAGLAAVAGRRIVIFRGEGGREALATGLRARGANVEYAECYRRTRPEIDPRPLIEGLSSGAVGAIVISSGEGLVNLARLLGEAGRELLAGVRLFVPHRRVAEDAHAFSFSHPVIAGPADEDMLAALVAYFSRAG